MNKRPTGLTVFAVINFIFVAVLFISLNKAFTSAETSITSYAFLSPLVTCILLVVSGTGFLSLNYRTGYIGGIVFCIFSLGNIFAYNALNAFEGFTLHIPSMVYPTLLLLMLIFKYKHAFKDNIPA